MGSDSPCNSTFPQIVHEFAGATRMDKCIDLDGRCWFCGGAHSRGMAVRKWVKSGFTTGNRVRCPSSETVCEACMFICSRTSPVPGRPPAPGKKFGGNFRNYSHCVEIDDGKISYFNSTKADPDRVTEFLRKQKHGTWFCAVAESGQKHVIPWAPPNAPGIRGVVSFDDVIVSIPDGDQWGLLDAIENLLLLGVPRVAIRDGRWSFNTIRDHRSVVQEFDAAWGHERGGGWFLLICHLSKKRKMEK